MNIINYSYSDTELKEILDSMIIIMDTREQKNQHISSQCIGMETANP